MPLDRSAIGLRKTISRWMSCKASRLRGQQKSEASDGAELYGGKQILFLTHYCMERSANGWPAKKFANSR